MAFVGGRYPLALVEEVGNGNFDTAVRSIGYWCHYIISTF